MTLLERLRKEGYTTPSEDFYHIIGVWNSWYQGKVDKFHRYRVYNGTEYVTCQRYSMGMAKRVCEDWANLLINEKVKITLEGKSEQDFFDRVCADSNFETRCNEMQELKAALGTVAYLPRVVGVPLDADSGEIIGTAGNIAIDYVFGKNIIPLAWENRCVTECAFASNFTELETNYTYVQIHQKNDVGEYDIINRLYDTTNDTYQEVPLSRCRMLKNVPLVVHTGSTEKQFVVDRLNLANNIDPNSPMGVAVFANAIDQLKACDVAYDSYVNEFVLGKKRIMVKPSAMKGRNGEPLFDASDVAFYWLPEDTQDESLIKEIDLSIRAQEFNMGLQDMLNTLSSHCGFGEAHYKFDQGSIKTATEVISQNSTLFRTVKKHEILLEKCLKELVRIILRLGNQYMGESLNVDVEVSIDFDDSIIEDKETEFKRDLLMLQSGIMNAYEFRMKWLNEDEATAKAALPALTLEPGEEEE